MNSLANYAKAFVGGLIAALTALGSVLVAGTGFTDVTAGSWVAVALAFLTTFAGVWSVPNRIPPEGP
jgi:hypothetical protein